MWISGNIFKMHLVILIFVVLITPIDVLFVLYVTISATLICYNRGDLTRTVISTLYSRLSGAPTGNRSRKVGEAQARRKYSITVTINIL